MTSIRRFGWAAFALIALVGCEPATPPATPTPAPSPSTEPTKAPSETKALPVEPGKPEESKKEGAAVETPGDKLTEEEIAEIKKLPANEQAIALEQVTCPIGKDHLGEMGVPIKQVIGDKTFFICCPSCEKEVKSDPAGVLAKLAKLKK